MIKVFDNFLTHEYLLHIQRQIPKLQYKLHNSLTNEPFNFLNSVGGFPQTDSFDLLTDKIRVCPFINFEGFLRCYVNLNPAGEIHAGKYHPDDGSITALFYPFDWDPEWGGETEFKIGEKVEYKKNRLVMFDSFLLHKANAHYSPGFRFTIAYKLEADWK